MNWIWIGVIISLILIELISLNFTAIWFVISGIVSYILLKFEYDYIVQVLSFVIVGFLFIIILRPKIINKMIDKRNKIIENMVNKHPIFIHLVPQDIRVENKIKLKKVSNKKKNKKKKNSCT